MSSHQQSPKSFWIHCNLCFVNYIQKERKMFILSCFHITCEKCARVVKQEQVECPICKKHSGRRLICNDLHPKLKELFHPRPWSLNFVKAYSVVKFQTKQRDHFMNGCRKMADYVRELEKERDRIKEECRKSYIRRQRIKEEHIQLAAVLNKLQRKKRNISLRMQRSSSIDLESILVTEQPKRYRGTVHPTCPAPENDFTFEFPNESRLSKSFIL